MSHSQMLDALHRSEERATNQTMHGESWKFFGPKFQPENEPLVGSIRHLSLKDTLSKSQMELVNQKPSLNMTRDDFNKLSKGKKASRKFIDENRKSISNYLNAVMKSEDNMLGYLNFTSQNLESGKPSVYDPAVNLEDKMKTNRT